MINLHERHQFRCFVVVLFKTQKFNTGFSVGKEVFDSAHKGPVVPIGEGRLMLEGGEGDILFAVKLTGEGVF